MSADSHSRPDLLDEILAAYLRAIEKGENPSRDELLARHPELAAELREFFADHDRMNRLAQPLCEPTLANPAIAPAERIRYFGDYEVLEEIARGGMGVVFKARQVTLNRIVAIKMILSGHLASPADVERFHTEAEAAAKLDHPGIVPIYEVGQHDGQHYFSMGFVDGVSLSAKVAQGPLPAREAAELVRTVAEAVQYAHDKGVIHRDLKPGNILLDEQGRPRVTDFGLAKLTESVSDLTGTGQILGTPGYMPPEQAAAQVSAVGRLSDVYSLGAILYCLLTGRPPFQAANPLETLMQVQKQEPVAPKQLNPAIPLDLDTIVLKCLEKSPSRRYASANSLAEELQRYLEGRPILARRISRPERFRRWCQREPIIASLSAAVLVALLTGTAVSAYFAMKERGRATAEAFQRGRADDKAALEQRRSIELADAMGKLQGEEKKVHAALIAERVATNDLEESNRNLRETINREQQGNYFNNVLLAWREWQAGHIEVAEKHLDACRADLRSWEWHYIARLCRPTESLAVLERVEGLDNNLDPSGMCLSADGMHIAYSCGDRAVGVLDATTGREQFRVVATHDVTSVAISHDGARLAALGEGRITVWEKSTVHSQVLPVDSAGSLEFSTDGRRLIIAQQYHSRVSRDDNLKRWRVGHATILDLETLKIVVSRRCRACSQDGYRIATSDVENEVVILNLRDNIQVKLPRNDAPVVSGDFSPDGTRIAIVDIASNIVVSDTATGEQVGAWHLRPEGIERIRFSPDGSKIATLSFPGNINVWDVRSGRRILSHRESEIAEPSETRTPSTEGDWHRDSVNRLFTFSPDSTRFASAFRNHKVTVWSLDTGKEAAFRTREPVRFVAFRPGAEHDVVYATQFDTQPTTAKLPPHSPLKELSVPWQAGGELFGVAFNPDGSLLAVAAGHNGIGFVDLASGEIRHLLFQKENPSHLVFFCKDGERILVSHQTGAAIHNLQTGEAIVRFPGGWVTAFNRDESRVATGGGGGFVAIWDAASAALILQLAAKENVYCVAFSPDSRRLAAADASGTIRVWDAISGQHLLDLPAHFGRAYTVTFSPDGKRLISMGDDGVLRLWDSMSGRAVLSLYGHVNRVYSATFTSDGSQIVSTSADGTIRIWDGRPVDDLAALASP